MKAKIKPIKFSTSLVIFIGAALLFLMTDRVVLPFFADKGASLLILFLLLAVPQVILLSGALYGYRSEGNKWSWSTFTKRFRFRPITGKLWFWALIIIVVDVALYLVVYKFGYAIVKRIYDAFPSPEILYDVMPNEDTFVGYTIQGNWWLLGLYGILYFFNVVGEELLWRGYLFPRQELTHGKYTWIVHGLLWTSFHLFAPYNALMVLPGALFMSYIVQRTQNNTLFLLSHAVLNGIPFVMLLLKIIG